MKQCGQKSSSLPEGFTSSTLLAGCTKYNFYPLKPMKKFPSGVLCTNTETFYSQVTKCKHNLLCVIL